MSSTSIFKKKKVQVLENKRIKFQNTEEIYFPRRCIICSSNTEGNQYLKTINSVFESNLDYKNKYDCRLPVCKECEKRFSIKTENSRYLILLSALIGIVLTISLYYLTRSIFIGLGLLAGLTFIAYLNYEAKIKKKLDLEKFLNIRLGIDNESLVFDFMNPNYADYVKNINSKEKMAERLQKKTVEETSKEVLEKDLKSQGEGKRTTSVIVGEKSFINFKVGNQVFKNIYNVFLKSIENNEDMKTIKVNIPISAPIRNNDEFLQFVYEILEYLEKNGRCDNKEQHPWDIELFFKYNKFQEINNIIGIEIDCSLNNFEEFFKSFNRNKKLFMEEKEAMLCGSVTNFITSLEKNLEKFYSSRVNDFTSKYYGLMFNASIETYFPSEEFVKVNDIPSDILENIVDLKIKKINGEEYLDGCYAFTYRVLERNKVDLGLIRLNDTGNVKHYIMKDDWHLGILIPNPSLDFGDSLRYHEFYLQILTDLNSRRLNSRVTLKDGKLVQYGNMWWNQKVQQEKHYLKNKKGLYYGITLVHFLITRFGNNYNIARINTNIFAKELSE